ncbi:MAG TPA: sigma 54-interacting transcriptional regulator, partial [Planctomycetaceae bacterium]|nr:sigma 54-interacting transcriptional regulator [Planctomycetaceae bacterium]
MHRRCRPYASTHAHSQLMFAQAIHRASPRREKPLVAINCAAVATNLLESELFGHKKGAFTGADRDEAVRQRQFREDLFYRMSVITIPIPPLRERRADIVPIAARLLERINTQFRTEERGYQDKSLSDSAIAFVKRHDWPGNVRQLYNVLL